MTSPPLLLVVDDTQAKRELIADILGVVFPQANAAIPSAVR
jgi:hypothetical protein